LNNGHFCHFDFFFVISTSSLSFRPKGEILNKRPLLDFSSLTLLEMTFFKALIPLNPARLKPRTAPGGTRLRLSHIFPI